MALHIPYVFAEVSLPNIGQSSVYKLDKEHEIGRRFHQALLDKNKIINDPLANFYLKEVTSILLQSLDKNLRRYQVSIIDDSAINAFAVPGGYIGINYGLILAAETEAQLAGVLAHEISHVALNHLSQLYERQEESNGALLTAILLGLILTQALDEENKGEAVEALMFGATAGVTQTMINFTRENEYEADRKGLEIMKKSDYPAIGMAEFFSILEGVGGHGELESIEYLRTHPVSENRMGEAYQFKSGKSVIYSNSNNEYEFFRVYLNSIVQADLKSSSKNKEILLFEKALMFSRENKYDEAIDILKKLKSWNEESLWFSYELIKLYIIKSDYKAALKAINKALLVYPQQPLFIQQKISVLVSLKYLKRALSLAREELNKNENNQSVRYLLVGIYEQLSEEYKAREVEADYMLIEGNLERAKYLYQYLINADKDSILKKGLEEKIKKIKRLENLKDKLAN